jgi:hypothetical protein
MRDPWGLTAAGILGGLAGAVTAALATPAVLALPVALGVAGVVYGVNAALGGLGGRRPAPVTTLPGAQLPAPTKGGAAEGWLLRAEAAVRTLRQQTESPTDPVLRAQISDVDDQAAGAVVDLRRFAGQVTLIEQAAARVDGVRLQREAAALDAAIARTPPGPTRDEQVRGRTSLAEQLDVVRRLAESRETLLARMQSAVLGLEGLVARMSELLALHASTEGGSLTATRVAELTSDLEGMRAGLAEAAAVSQVTLAQGGGAGGVG